MKKIVCLLSFMVMGNAMASHPHDILCTISAKTQNHESVQLFLQIQSERTYIDGDPNKDVHDFTYQARICDDDNDLSASACSTFESRVATHKADEVFELVSMVNKNELFF